MKSTSSRDDPLPWQWITTGPFGLPTSRNVNDRPSHKWMVANASMFRSIRTAQFTLASAMS
jgi:hypothetical protein